MDQKRNSITWSWISKINAGWPKRKRRAYASSDYLLKFHDWIKTDLDVLIRPKIHGIGWAGAVIPVLVWAPHCSVTVPKTEYKCEPRFNKNKMQILKLIAQVKNQEKSLFWQNLTLRFYFQDSTHVRLKGTLPHTHPYKRT